MSRDPQAIDAKRQGRILTVALALCGTTLTAPDPVHAAMNALVIGIDEYRYGRNLRGAVNDARDIADTLRGAGAKNVVLLLNHEATHKRISDAWHGLIRSAEPGDTLFLTYAGHGGQEPEHVPNSETDGLDETFLLSDFNPKSLDGAQERIIDNEINAWLLKANDKGIRVVFVADSCHSGTMMRSMDARATALVRASPLYSLPEDLPVPAESKAGSEITEKDLPQVMFLSATTENLKSPEVVIEGEFRGALSWAFARAIDGRADQNNDGVTTRFELQSYVLPAVRMLSESRQIPDMRPRGVQDQPVFEGYNKVDAQNNELQTPELPNLPVSILNLPSSDATKLVAHLNGTELAGSGTAADLIWDAEAKEVLSSTGDVVAQNIGDQALQGVVNKWRVISLLRDMVQKSPLILAMQPNDGHHEAGKQVAFSSAPVKYPYLTAINLTPDGQLHLLYPLHSDPASWTRGQAYSLKLKVRAPFGADHLLIIASEKPLIKLHKRISESLARDLPLLLHDALRGIDHQIGIQGLYTRAGRRY